MLQTCKLNLKTAKTSNTIHFLANQHLFCLLYRGFVEIKIVNEGKLDKQVNFQVVLGEPRWALDGNQDEGIDTTSLGAPRIKSPASVTVVIVASQRLRQIVDNLANMDYTNFVTTSSWSEQFHDALTISGGQEGLGPKWYDYILHFVSLFWKLLIAVVPPTGLILFMPCNNLHLKSSFELNRKT